MTLSFHSYEKAIPCISLDLIVNTVVSVAFKCRTILCFSQEASV